jgi:hypothetical protein
MLTAETNALVWPCYTNLQQEPLEVTYKKTAPEYLQCVT